MDVDVPLFKDAVVDTERINMRLDILQCNDGRLLHHIAEVSCQRQLAGFSL